LEQFSSHEEPTNRERMDWKKPLAAGLGIFVVVVVIWGFFVVQFESPLGTDNVVEI